MTARSNLDYVTLANWRKSATNHPVTCSCSMPSGCQVLKISSEKLASQVSGSSDTRRAGGENPRRNLVKRAVVMATSAAATARLSSLQTGIRELKATTETIAPVTSL